MDEARRTRDRDTIERRAKAGSVDLENEMQKAKQERRAVDRTQR